MNEEEHHESLIEGISTQFAEIFENSDQGIYIYLDDTHKVCNKNFSDMLGYESPEAWAQNEDSFTQSFVDEDSARALVGAYGEAMQRNIGSQIDVVWKKKNDETVKTEVILVPVAYEGHIFALHFVTPVE